MPGNAYPGNGLHAFKNLINKWEVLPSHHEVVWETNTRTFPYPFSKYILSSCHGVNIRLSSSLQVKPCFALVVSNKIEMWFSQTLCVSMNIHGKWVSSSSKGSLFLCAAFTTASSCRSNHWCCWKTCRCVPTVLLCVAWGFLKMKKKKGSCFMPG